MSSERAIVIAGALSSASVFRVLADENDYTRFVSLSSPKRRFPLSTSTGKDH